MGLNLLSTAVALALLLTCHVEAMTMPVVLPKIFDATRDQLRIINRHVPEQLHDTRVENWPEVVDTVMRGSGVEIQRTKEVQLKWQEFLSGHDRDLDAISEHMAKKLGWIREFNFLPDLLDESAFEFSKDKEVVKFTAAEFPTRLPHGVEHHHLWVRVPLTTHASFLPKEGEKVPNQRWTSYKEEELIEFFNAHDFFGTNLSPDKVRDYAEEVAAKRHEHVPTIGEDMWPQNRRRKANTYRGFVEREDGIEAMQWVSRHITRLIAKQFPKEQFVWFRVNRSLRTFHTPNQIHVLVNTKGDQLIHV